MATNKKPQKSKKRAAPARKNGRAKEMSLADLFKKRKDKDFAEFKPDAKVATFGKTLRMTQQQRLRFAKWGLYVLTIILCLTVQDVIMSQFSLFGATTDLAVCAILLITVIEGTEVGSVFVLIASTLYYFSGTAPNSNCIVLMTVFGVAATMFRQMFWHRSNGSVILCSGIAVTCYEIGMFVVGMMNGLTHFGRIGAFVLTAVLSCIALIPLYSLIYKIGMIGGNTWKE